MEDIRLNLISLVRRTVNKNNTNKQVYFGFIDESSILESFEALKKWIRYELDLGRSIQLGDLGVISNQFLNKEEVIFLKLNEKLLLKFKLSQETSNMKYHLFPTISINFKNVSKYLTKSLKLEILTQSINSLILEICDIIIKYESFELEVDILGRICKNNKLITIIPYSNLNKLNKNRKVTIKTIIKKKEMEKNILMKKKESKIKTKNENITNSKKNINSNSNSKIYESIEKSNSKITNNIFNLNDKNFINPLKRIQKIDENEFSNELFIAGSDPLSLYQDYSYLADNARNLLNKKFKKPPNSKIRNPPIIDSFSRTLAAPICTQYNSLSASNRIGLNYTPLSKYLFIDKRSKVLKYLKIKENKTKLYANGELLQELSKEEEDIKYLIDKDNCNNELIKKVISKQKCYNRYKDYIFNEIKNSIISKMKQEWITNVLDTIPSSYEYLDVKECDNLIDDLLKSINDNYKIAIKKSILDFILKDKQEQLRIGITNRFDSAEEWGEKEITQIKADNNWISKYSNLKHIMENNINLFCSGTLKIKIVCGPIENDNFFKLPVKFNELYLLNEFKEIQELNRDRLKQIITGNWIQDITEVYKKDITNITNKDLYYESISNLMSTQIRDIITRSIESYLLFFKKFKKDKYLNVYQCIEKNTNVYDLLEKSFLVVRLKEDQNKIILENEELEILNTIISLINEVIKISEGLPRPENVIKNSEKKILNKVGEMPKDNEDDKTIEEVYFYEIKEEIKLIIKENMKEINQCKDIFEPFLFLLKEKDKIEDFKLQELTQDDFLKKIKLYEDTFEKINEEIPFEIYMNMIKIDCSEMKKKLLDFCNGYKKDILIIMKDLIFQYNVNLINELNYKLDEFSNNPKNEKNLVNQQNLLSKLINDDQYIIIDNYKSLKSWVYLYYDTQDEIPHEFWNNLHKTFCKISSLSEKINEIEAKLDQDKQDIENNLQNQKVECIKNIKNLCDNIEEFKLIKDCYQISENYDKVIILYDHLNRYINKKTEINEKEKLIGLSKSSFENLKNAELIVNEFKIMWDIIKDWKEKKLEWLKKTKVINLNYDEVEKSMKKKINLAKLTVDNLKQIIGNSNHNQHINFLNDNIKNMEDFNKNLPLIKFICNPGLMKRHFDEFEKISLENNIELKWEKENFNYNLEELISNDLNKIIDKLLEISDKGSREYTNQKLLEEMEKEWKDIILEIKSYKIPGTFVITGNTVDEVMAILDDHLVKTQTIKGSPYAVFFKKRIDGWEDSMIYIKNCIDYLIKVQGLWIYMEPIFSSEDIMKSLPEQGSKFKEIDSSWRYLMQRINTNPLVIEINKNKKLLNLLKEMNETLELIHKKLNSYLDKKRSEFPRFYFLSQDSLIEVLSEAKDPTRIQKFCKILFEGIQRLEFNENKEIEGICSSEGEYIKFSTPINTEIHKGLVEQWLRILEEKMIEEIRNLIESSIHDYAKLDREEFVLNRPGQAVLNINMTIWTAEVEDILNENGYNGLKNYCDVLQYNIDKIVKLVKTNITKLDRCTLEALIVLDVHNRDIVKHMIEYKVESINDFNYEAQLRYYWEQDIENENEKLDTIVKIINSNLKYNYEYLGNSNRLVITPLTDRCYRTLCGAISLNYGGAPEGPAGTGKTETVKDLAKALGRMIVVFNCNDKMDFKSMGRFFKGLASSGGWTCLDEFNRINLEVLSVIAQQIQEIQNAIALKKENFNFEGSYISLKLTCNCFITMNPGYAGRSELPDNLKALFRSVAMMVPDYAMIAEIRLYSFGFFKAKILAKKIVTTYKLCSEQILAQKHYDYGMRAVNSVLVAAGNLRKSFPDEEEDVQVLKAILEVNEAKFLNADTKLFKDITQDLFPSTNLTPQDFNNLLECIKYVMDQNNLVQTDYFMKKIIDLYQMIKVRHGLMVVGDPYSCKSTNIRVLRDALNYMNEKGYDENKVITEIINPKSIENILLYGYTDIATNEWTDGVLPVKFKEMANDSSTTRKWLIFDGPVDAVWIENMNTVLDDNKKLCLSNGDVFYMSKTMNMIFEPMDLLEASPATVSRCGMVYMEPHMMGWKFIYYAWKNTLPNFLEEDKDAIDMFFFTILDPLITLFIKNKFTLTNPISIQATVENLLKLVNKLIKTLESLEYETQDFKNRISIFDQILVFCTIWSFGASIDSKNRKKFDSCLKRFINTCDKSVDIIYQKKHRKIRLPDSNLFDFELKLKKNPNNSGERNIDLGSEWIKWINKIDESIEIQENFNPNQILIETADTVRYSYLINIYFEENYHSLICGSTGTGKTAYIKNAMNNLDKNNYLFCEIGFSSKIHVSKIQEIIESNLIRKQSKGVFGPPSKKKMIIFIDDFSMPKKEEYGSQPPIELIRQLVDQKGFYDNKEKNKPFKNIIDFVLIASMSKATSSENHITPRMTRHLSLLSFIEFEEEQMKRIYLNILSLYWKTREFNDEIKKLSNKIINASYDLYNVVLNNYLPTPNKSHYLFNLRDFGKVIFGICLANNESLVSTDQLIKLWIHENWRVFGDRLNNEQDRLDLLNLHIKKIFQKTFGMNFDNTFSYLDDNKDKQVSTLSEMRNLIFSDVLGLRNSYKPYEEIKDVKVLNKSLNKYLCQYNMVSDKKLNIVLFNFAIEHLLIISRIFKQQGGHAMLVGIGGSGRKSLSIFSAFISNYNVFEIELTQNYNLEDWHNDIKNLLKMSGGKAKDTVFIFSDTQIKIDDFVEDINNLLNNGIIPSLFEPEEKAEILELARIKSKEEERELEKSDELYEFFIEKVKKHLHISLTFSPIGDSFRERIRIFPSLVNCCTIDWFFEWPKEALINVATNFLEDLEINKDIKSNCIEIVELFHSNSKEWSAKFKKELGRINYITPTIYIELINQFKLLFKERNNFVENLQFKYENGYKMIIEAEQNVHEMQIKLTDLVPELEESKIETEEAMVIVSKKTEEAESKQKLVSVDEEKARKIKDRAEGIKQSCEKDLEEIKPKLEKAEKGLKNLDESKIKNMRGAKVLSKPLMYLFFGVGIVLGSGFEKIKNPNTLKYEIDWNGTGLKVLQRKGLALELQEYNNEEMMDEKTYLALKDHFENADVIPYLKYLQIKNANEDATSIFIWLECQKDLYIVNKELKPKKANYNKACEEVDIVTEQLNIKQKELNIVQENINRLKADLEDKKNNKEILEARYKKCKVELTRAKTLIENLLDEKDRWLELGNIYKNDISNVVGDVLISAGFICYLGPFTAKYRENILKNWISKTQELNIPQSKEYDIIKILGDPILIRDWNINGLPEDNFSISNGIILSKSNRWPLMIDPQLQANKWIKNLWKKENLTIIKQQGDYLKKLEMCIRLGNPVLLENVNETLEPALSPILLKQFFKNGSIKYIKIGDQIVEYNDNFKFFITCKLMNPHYLPEISTKVEIINFMITFTGLKDQLLALIVKQEKPKLETDRENLIIEGANNKQELKNLENKILEELASNKDNLLENETAINILTASKTKSIEIKEKQKISEETEKEIEKARQNYIEISKNSSCLFFVITEMANIEPTYQYSLVYFIDLYLLSIKNSEKSDDISNRLENISEHFWLSLYNNVSRSIFVKDKLLFSFLLCIRLKEFKKEISSDKYELFLKGTISIPNNLWKKPDHKWLTQKIWIELNTLNNYKEFNGLIDNFNKDISFWENIMNSYEPYKELLPNILEKKLSDFDKLLLIKALRPDKLIPMISLFIIKNLGKKFIKPPKFSLDLIYSDSNNSTPLIFILTPGINPYNSLLNFSKEKKVNLDGISLGQGQGPIALKLIDHACDKGNWIVLQNCHLAEGFMPILEKKCNEILENQSQINSDFRLWLTTYPTKFFPTSILQNGIKMTNEPPKGLNNNLLNAFNLDIIQDNSIFQDCDKINEFQRLLYGLCFFHSIIQERRSYGSLGWNIPYEFTESDLRISVKQLKLFLNKYPEILPLEALKYLTAQCNYGGRVTDDKDRRLIETLLEDYYNDSIAYNDEQVLMTTDDYNFKIPSTIITLQGYINEINRIPSIITDPSIYGFNKNASITKDLKETNDLLNTLLLTQGGKGENDNLENITKDLINNILNEFPAYFDLEKSLSKFPIIKEESMNTVFNQELIRYNNLLKKVKITLEDIVKAIDGKILFTEELELSRNYIENGRIPLSWLKVSYPSLKSLTGYIKDLFKKIEFFKKWFDEGQPSEFWISGFYFTHGFLTGILQNFARKYKIEIDKLDFEFEIKDENEELEKVEDGSVVYGLFLEACRYNYNTQELDESEPKVLFYNCPKIYLKPNSSEKIVKKPSYECPLYKTSSRRGELLTTGQSTNFVMFINLPSSKKQSHWIKRGVAALTQLND